MASHSFFSCRCPAFLTGMQNFDPFDLRHRSRSRWLTRIILALQPGKHEGL
jgi:hypothetical protein